MLDCPKCYTLEHFKDIKYTYDSKWDFLLVLLLQSWFSIIVLFSENGGKLKLREYLLYWEKND